MRSNGIATALLLGAVLTVAAAAQTNKPPTAVGPREPHLPSMSPRDALLARAKSLELNTTYVPPPGDPLEHHASGFAKIMCSAVFITGLDPEFAAENVGYFTSPYAERSKVGKPVIDRAAKAVHVALPNGVTLTAKYLGSQGCVTLPAGQSSVNFTPVQVKPKLPDPSKQPWPMGDVLPKDPYPSQLDMNKVKQAVDAALEIPAEMTAAFVVTWKGRLVGERYAQGITSHTPLESWSMGKSVTATMMGILIKQGVYELGQPAPIPEWQAQGRPARENPDSGSSEHVERAADQSAPGSRLRSERHLS